MRELNSTAREHTGLLSLFGGFYDVDFRPEPLQLWFVNEEFREGNTHVETHI